MSRQHEPNLNNNLAQLLDRMFSQSQVQPENTDASAKNPSKRPDISSLWSHCQTANWKTKPAGLGI